jgi:hypothetical protein
MIKYLISYSCGSDLLIECPSGSPVANPKSGPDYSLFTTKQFFFFKLHIPVSDCLCGLVDRVPGYRSRDPGFDYRHYQIF